MVKSFCTFPRIDPLGLVDNPRLLHLSRAVFSCHDHPLAYWLQLMLIHSLSLGINAKLFDLIKHVIIVVLAGALFRISGLDYYIMCAMCING